jgi:hypothetical protein
VLCASVTISESRARASASGTVVMYRIVAYLRAVPPYAYEPFEDLLAAARTPVARVKNLIRALKTCQEAGYIVVGLDTDADTGLFDLEVALAEVARSG